MQKLLATLAIIMSCGVVVLIAQNENFWDMSDVTKIEGGKVFPGGPSVEEHKAEAEQYIRGMMERGMTDEQIRQDIEDRYQADRQRIQSEYAK